MDVLLDGLLSFEATVMSRKLLGIKRLKANPPASSWVILAAVFVSASFALAGDPIQFSGGKGKSGPQQERKVEGDLLKSFNKDGNPFLNSLTPWYAPTRNDPKDEKRLKKQREEERNWMLKDPEKKDASEELFGPDEFLTDDMEEDEGFDPTFAPLVRKAANKNRSTASPQAVSRSEDSTPVGSTRDVEVLGTHTSREMDLKNLLNTSQVNPDHTRSAEPSLFEFLRENAAPTLSRDEVARKEQFEKFLNSSPTDSMQPRMMDPINFAPDLTQQRINPVMPSAGPSAFDAGLARPQELSPKRDFGVFDARSSPNSALGRPLAPGYPQQNSVSRDTRPSVLGSGSMFNNNTVRRPGT